MAYSMTGFGAAEGATSRGRLRAEIRTVNHRFFNLAAKLPTDLAALEPDLRERLRQEFDRGHIAVQIRWLESADREPELTVNIERARMVAERLQGLQAMLGLGGRVDLDLIARQPEVLSWSGAVVSDVPWREVEPIVAEAAGECRAMRRREGAALVGELIHRLDELSVHAATIAERAPERLPRERDRLRNAVAQLLDGRMPDEHGWRRRSRFLADKLDITEELVRFRTHVAAARERSLPIGRRASSSVFWRRSWAAKSTRWAPRPTMPKSPQQVIAMKGELEKFREQLENLE